MRASRVVKRQSTRHLAVFRWRSQAATSWVKVSGLGIRRSKHCVARTLSSVSAIFNQLPLWSAIIESPRRQQVDLQTACTEYRPQHHWTTRLPAATIARHEFPASGGCPAYVERTALSLSRSAMRIHAADAPWKCCALSQALSALIRRTRSRKPFPTQTVSAVPGTPHQAPTHYRCHPV